MKSHLQVRDLFSSLLVYEVNKYLYQLIKKKVINYSHRLCADNAENQTPTGMVFADVYTICSIHAIAMFHQLHDLTQSYSHGSDILLKLKNNATDLPRFRILQ